MNSNPFNHIYKDPSGPEIMVAAMDDDVLLKFLRHFLIEKPEHDLSVEKSVMLSDYVADPGMDERTANLLGLKLPSEEEIRHAEKALADIRRRIEIEAIAKSLPYMLVALVRNSTRDEAVKIVHEFTGPVLAHQVEYQIWNRDIIQMLPAPEIVEIDDEEVL